MNIAKIGDGDLQRGVAWLSDLARWAQRALASQRPAFAQICLGQIADEVRRLEKLSKLKPQRRIARV
ncbi:MAG: hypothetical protein HYY24_11985 [Verrucomicrobia bacterium]|nr:hypothetical protein [Verrucomicrobiota bacterium]